MDDGKIYITISDERKSGGDGGGVLQTPEEQTQSQQDNKESVLRKYTNHRFFNFIQSEA